MAKPKRTQALFEVINAHNSRVQKKATQAPSAPKAGLIASSVSWFKNRGNKPHEPYDPTSASRIGANDHSLGTPAHLPMPEHGDASIPPAQMVVPPPAVTHSASVAITPPSAHVESVIAEPHLPAYPSHGHGDSSGFISTASLAPSTSMAVDRDHQQISFRLNYSSAIIGTVALIAVLALAYRIGSRAGTTSQGSPTSSYLLSQPANPDVMDVGQASLQTQTTSVGAGRATPGDDELVEQPPAPRTAANTTGQGTTPASLSTQRVIGMNYVIIQSYPTKEEAKAAAEILSRYGVETTLEQNLPDWANNNWYSVVGLKPFDRTSNSPAYNEYINTLTKISKKFAGSSQFKQFQPAAYRWRAGR